MIEKPAPSPPVAERQRPSGFYRGAGKRVFDLLSALVLLLALSPVLAVVSLVVMATLGRPILFRQVRPGRGGRPFTIFKFRSMTEPSAAGLDVVPDEDRLGGVGRFLRATSLDELPELVNVVRGEMSLIGPRPLLMAYLGRYSPEQARRHEVLPGITGWAQVRGRNLLSWEEKFELDVWYVDHLSLSVDLRILGLTVWRVVRREAISARGHATMPEFRGTVNE